MNTRTETNTYERRRKFHVLTKFWLHGRPGHDCIKEKQEIPWLQDKHLCHQSNSEKREVQIWCSLKTFLGKFDTTDASTGLGFQVKFFTPFGYGINKDHKSIRVLKRNPRASGQLLNGDYPIRETCSGKYVLSPHPQIACMLTSCGRVFNFC